MPSGVYIRTEKHLEILRNRKFVPERMSREIYGSKNPRWNSGLLSYSGVHVWLKNTFGKASQCENCERTEKVQWADKKHRGKKSKFQRNRDDWMQLCIWCHKIFDGHIGPMSDWGKHIS